MDKKALINSGRLQFPYKNRTHKNFIAQPKINLKSFKSTPDSLKQRFKAFGRKPSLGASEHSSVCSLLFPIKRFVERPPFLNLNRNTIH